jgi:hypothetical protein
MVSDSLTTCYDVCTTLEEVGFSGKVPLYQETQCYNWVGNLGSTLAFNDNTKNKLKTFAGRQCAKYSSKHTLHILIYLIISLVLWDKYYYPYFTDGETKAQ